MKHVSRWLVIMLLGMTLSATEALGQRPDPVTQISPPNDVDWVPLRPRLLWEPVANATSYDVYFNGRFILTQTETSFIPGPLQAGGQYTWRIDARNSSGVTPGQESRFRTTELRNEYDFDISRFDLQIARNLSQPDRVMFQAEFDLDPEASSVLFPPEEAIWFHFGYVGQPLNETDFSVRGGSRDRRLSWRAANGQGTFLMNVGGSSRCKTQLQFKGNYRALVGIQDIWAEMDTVYPVWKTRMNVALRGINGLLGSTFSAARRNESEGFYVDSLNVRQTLSPVSINQLRLTAHVGARFEINPFRYDLELQIDQMIIRIPKNGWTRMSSNTLTFIQRNGNSQVTLTYHLLNRSFNLMITNRPGYEFNIEDGMYVVISQFGYYYSQRLFSLIYPDESVRGNFRMLKY